MNIRPPAQGGKVGTYDPNYQTLAGMNNDDVFKRKVLVLIFSSRVSLFDCLT